MLEWLLVFWCTFALSGQAVVMSFVCHDKTIIITSLKILLLPYWSICWSSDMYRDAKICASLAVYTGGRFNLIQFNSI